MTRYEPPQGYSPASLRYVEKMQYDNVALTAAVVSLAVKGYLRINENDKQHTLDIRETIRSECTPFHEFRTSNVVSSISGSYPSFLMNSFEVAT